MIGVLMLAPESVAVAIVAVIVVVVVAEYIKKTGVDMF
jgi:hypothetical protein